MIRIRGPLAQPRTTPVSVLAARVVTTRIVNAAPADAGRVDCAAAPLAPSHAPIVTNPIIARFVVLLLMIERSGGRRGTPPYVSCA
jgi:hypothetical protein